MKTLFISSWYPSPANKSKGTFVKKHAASIKDSGVEIVVLAVTLNYDRRYFYQKNIFHFIDVNHVPTHLIEINSRFYKWLYILLPLQYLILLRYYWKKIKPAFEPDV